MELDRSQVAACEAGKGVEQQAVDNCTIRARVAGIVVSKDAQVGEMVSTNSAGGGFTRTGIATIVDMKSNEFEVDVNESFIARVEPGQDVKEILDACHEREIHSKVRTIIPSADRQKATVKVRISIPNLEKYNFILPDMSVKVSFEGPPQSAPAKGPEALAYIPKSAIRTGAGASFVFRVKDGKVERRAISVGMDRGTDVAILAGVTPGDSLVVKVPASSRDGEQGA